MTTLKKILIGLSAVVALFSLYWLTAYAATVFNQTQGGTATSTKFTNGQLIYQNANGYAGATLIQGSNITINTSTAGQITLSTTGGSSATTTINGLSVVNYTFSTGTAGSIFDIATSAPGTVIFNLPFADATHTGQLQGSDWTIFNNKQASLVSGTNIKTVNGNSLLGSGDLTVTGNSAWTIGNGLIYNATTTDLVGIGTITPTTTLFVQGKSGTNPFAIASSSGTQLLTVTQTGNIGIGTTTPASTLHVAYDASSTASTNYALQLGTKALSSPSANGTYVGLNVPSSFTGNMIELQNNGTSQFKVTSAGSTLIPSGSLFGAGATSADGGFAIASNNGVELGVGTGKAFIATTAGSKFGQLCVIADAVWGLGQTVSSPTTCGATQAVLVWTGGGLVGIGTSTPIGVLSVQGTSGNLIDVYNGATSEFRITSAGVLTTAGNATISGGTLTAATKVQTNLVSANTTNLTLSGNMSSTAVGDDVTVLNGTSRNTTGAGNATAINIQDTFAPTTGTATFHALHISSIINQTNSASGISRGVFVNPTLTTVADFRALETAAKTVTYSTATIPSIAYQVLFNPYTYVTSSTTNATLSTSTTVDIKGAPIASTTNLAITNSIGLQIESNAVTASTTNAYGAYFWAPSGATNNWSAGFTGHVVYNGPTPVISSCGATPNGSATGNDERFTITVGGGVVTACTATFASTFKNTPVCTVTDNSATIGAGITSASNSAITISTSASLGGGVIYVRCDDWN